MLLCSAAVQRCRQGALQKMLHPRKMNKEKDIVLPRRLVASSTTEATSTTHHATTHTATAHATTAHAVAVVAHTWAAHSTSHASGAVVMMVHDHRAAVASTHAATHAAAVSFSARAAETHCDF
jgi:hypothetical protein